MPYHVTQWCRLVIPGQACLGLPIVLNWSGVSIES
jgi:hypothetical protein